jgi:hypothetical protein
VTKTGKKSITLALDFVRFFSWDSIGQILSRSHQLHTDSTASPHLSPPLNQQIARKDQAFQTQTVRS